ncbi:hypothetical protein V8E53_003631 [Lactarius tabidus]
MPALIPVGNVLGAFFIGVILSSILYGVTCLQVYSYFSKHSQNDRLFLKCFLALVVHGFYVAGVTNFGDYLADLKAPWSLKVQSLLGSFTPGEYTTFILSLAELGLGIVYLVHWRVTSQLPFHGFLILHSSFQYPYFTQAEIQIPNSTAGLSIQVACDLTITASMVYYLLTRHDTIAKRIFAIACLATFVRYSHTLIYAPFFFVLVRLYACAFMAVLNSRDRLRTSLNAAAEPEVEKGTMIVFHGTSTLSHIGDSDVTSTSTSAPNTDAVGGPRFATQSTISGVSRTKPSISGGLPSKRDPAIESSHPLLVL